MKEKEALKSLALSKLKNGALIYQILESDVLDSLITKIIDKDKFLDNLKNFISFFKYMFAPLNYYEASIIMLLKTQPKFLVSKKKWNVNNFKKYYLKEFKVTCVTIFKENMQFIGYNISNNVNELFNFYRKLIWSNFYYHHVIDILFVSYKDRLNNKIKKVSLNNKSRIDNYNRLKKEYEDGLNKLLYNYNLHKDRLDLLIYDIDNENRKMVKAYLNLLK